LGLRNFYVQAGGDLYLSGTRFGRPWRAGIRDPRGPPDRSFAHLELSDVAFSTSGDYERFFVAGGVRYHHLIDPRTCWPSRRSRSATVLAKSATDAEILTKATFMLGGKEGLELARAWGAEAILVDGEGKVHASPGIDGRMVPSP
ncbi:MAG: FAD:protein FMN transferase, partial [Myxococcales bacterium]|nr:FAD:protein FMN transferase [Myxococcales bacterium]